MVTLKENNSKNNNKFNNKIQKMKKIEIIRKMKIKIRIITIK